MQTKKKAERKVSISLIIGKKKQATPLKKMHVEIDCIGNSLQKSSMNLARQMLQWNPQGRREEEKADLRKLERRCQ